MSQERPDGETPNAPKESSDELQETQETDDYSQTPDEAELASLTVSARWRGPLPPPNQLAAYNDAVPNGAERILEMAEKRHAHAIETEQVLIRGGLRLALVGQITGLTVALAILGLAAYMVSAGATVAAAVIAAIDIASVVSIFVLGSRGRLTHSPDLSMHEEATADE